MTNWQLFRSIQKEFRFQQWSENTAHTMNKEEKPRSESISKTKKPGPRPTACLWCNATDCNHCRCTGQVGCSHKKGEMCSNPRYKRRLVCNSCEKNKLREKQQSNASKAETGKDSIKECTEARECQSLASKGKDKYCHSSAIYKEGRRGM